MPLTPGTTLGPYEVLSAIGVGGMGEVYKARDTKLDRDVALKILPDAFVNDPERLARFQREAKVLASLNHPNIAAIYGLEEAGDSPALVLEYVEGPTLQDRIGKGPIPLDEALPIARQIAEALEAAHEQGIIHRDLKPANVKVKDDGTVKVLDFGLAKALAPDLSDTEAANSPTMTMTAAATKMGVIMGTAAYMSPEQARGKQVDKRADIWAFGVVLFEMLTGRQAFGATDISQTLALVLTREVEWTALPTKTPASVRRMLRRCVTRDRKNRLADISVARLEIDEANVAPEPVEAATIPVAQLAFWQRPAVITAMLLVAIVVTGFAVWSITRSTSPVRRPSRFTLTTPEGAPVRTGGAAHDIAISPDGSRVVYVAQPGSGGGSRLDVRGLTQLDTFPLRGPAIGTGPFFSPDGNWIGYWDGVDQMLKKVLAEGGPPITLTSVLSTVRGAAWGPDDTIIFGTAAAEGLWRVSATGGSPEVLTTFEEGEGNHIWPSILPGGQAVLFTVQTGAANTLSDLEIAVLRLSTGEWTRLGIAGSDPRYVPTGHVVYGLDQVLMAVPFSLDELAVSGDPVPVVEGVRTKNSGAANFGIASDGTLVYVSGGGLSEVQRTLVWVDRLGNEEPLPAEPRAYDRPRISPDGTRVALEVVAADRDIWIWDIARERLTRLTFDPLTDQRPIWTPDGERVVFSSDRNGRGNLFWKPADGTGAAELLHESPTITFPNDITPDGAHLIFREDVAGRAQDLRLVALEGDRNSEDLLTNEFADRDADLSPDGKWLAFESTAAGASEVYVVPFPDVGGGQWQVSWRRARSPVGA